MTYKKQTGGERLVDIERMIGEVKLLQDYLNKRKLNLVESRLILQHMVFALNKQISAQQDVEHLPGFLQGLKDMFREGGTNA